MTVCVAAIFEQTGILGACDRMITAGDIQFEPALPKIRYLTTSCVAMIAGDANLQADIFQGVKSEVDLQIDLEPNRWLSIREIADMYKRSCDDAIGKMAERRLLSPFGMTRADFLSRQNELSAEFVKDIAHELLNFEAPCVEVIISGVDTRGPHLYTVDNSSVTCHDSVGFAAIGGGHWHANSQMMNFNHTPRHSLADTLMSVFFAKKRAEIAPGVGPVTDMYIVTGLGSSDSLNVDVQRELEKNYADEKRRQQKIASSSRKNINNFVQGLIAIPQRDQNQPPDPAVEGDSPPALKAPEE